MILSCSMSHGVNYHYRIHKAKLETCKIQFPNLSTYLISMRQECPIHYFLEGPRSSCLRFIVPTKPQKINHEVAYLARMGLESNYYDNAHMNVQMFMLSFDSKTLAIEIPLWLTKDEFVGYEKLFQSDLALSGHIDLIRIEDGKIWIWDFKPKACKEKYAVTQTYFYALMLSKRTNIALENFMCGYFDDLDVYVFNPSTIDKSLIVPAIKKEK